MTSHRRRPSRRPVRQPGQRSDWSDPPARRTGLRAGGRSVGPKIDIGARVGEPNRDTGPSAGPPHGAANNDRDAPDNVRLWIERRWSRILRLARWTGYLQLLEASEVGHQVSREAVGEIALLRVAADVLEREHDHDRAAGRRNGISTGCSSRSATEADGRRRRRRKAAPGRQADNPAAARCAG